VLLVLLLVGVVGVEVGGEGGGGGGGGEGRGLAVVVHTTSTTLVAGIIEAYPNTAAVPRHLDHVSDFVAEALAAVLLPKPQLKHATALSAGSALTGRATATGCCCCTLLRATTATSPAPSAAAFCFSGVSSGVVVDFVFL
jgi:hypothetical protein